MLLRSEVPAADSELLVVGSTPPALTYCVLSSTLVSSIESTRFRSDNWACKHLCFVHVCAGASSSSALSVDREWKGRAV